MTSAEAIICIINITYDIGKVEHADLWHYEQALYEIKDMLETQPERKKGKWIRNDNGTYTCSVCQSWIPEEQHCYAQYCLYCGVDMRGTEG